MFMCAPPCVCVYSSHDCVDDISGQSVFCLLFVSSVSPLAGGYISHSPNFWQTVICLCFPCQNDGPVVLTSGRHYSLDKKQISREEDGKRRIFRQTKWYHYTVVSMNERKLMIFVLLQHRCCGRVSDVDPAQMWLMIKTLNYRPWLSSEMLIQHSPMCSVRVTVASAGNKYGLYLVLCLALTLSFSFRDG